MEISKYVQRAIRPEKAGFDRTGRSDVEFLRQELGPSVDAGKWARFNTDWFVSVNGGLLHMSGYYITPDRLSEEDWLLHLSEKTWFDANTFIPVFFYACRVQKKAIAQIQTYY